MEWNNGALPTTAVIENAKYEISQGSSDRIIIEQHTNIQQPRQDMYLTITKRDVDKIKKCCKLLEKRAVILSDVSLSIGSLALGAFFSAFFGGVRFSTSVLDIIIYSLVFAIGCVAFVVAVFQKKQESVDSKKTAADIEEIIDYISQQDEEA